MTSWHSKTTLQKLLDLAGLHCTTSERPGLTQHAAQLLVQALLISFSFQQHDWSRANLKGPVSHLSLSPCTGSRLQLVSSLRHWCLHIEQPQAQHRLRTLLLPLPYNNLHPFQKSEICERGSPRGSITERDKITLQSYPPPRRYLLLYSIPSTGRNCLWGEWMNGALFHLQSSVSLALLGIYSAMLFILVHTA